MLDSTLVHIAPIVIQASRYGCSQRQVLPAIVVRTVNLHRWCVHASQMLDQRWICPVSPQLVVQIKELLCQCVHCSQYWRSSQARGISSTYAPEQQMRIVAAFQVHNITWRRQAVAKVNARSPRHPCLSCCPHDRAECHGYIVCTACYKSFGGCRDRTPVR